MTNYLGWTPPPGVAVVSPPVHVETLVDLFFSDASHSVKSVRAGSQNWSAVGDGPSVVAYRVVEEYKPATELGEWWLAISVSGFVLGAWEDRSTAESAPGTNSPFTIIHVREVPDPSREVVAWAVWEDGVASLFQQEWAARKWQDRHGGTVVRLTGVKP